MMPKIKVVKHSTTIRGHKRTTLVTAFEWHRSVVPGANLTTGKARTIWYYIVPDEKGEVLAKARVYLDDTNRFPKIKGRIYRWDVYPGTEGYSFARGECMSLGGAKYCATQCAIMADRCKPYIESVHRK